MNVTQTIGAARDPQRPQRIETKPAPRPAASKVSNEATARAEHWYRHLLVYR